MWREDMLPLETVTLGTLMTAKFDLEKVTDYSDFFFPETLPNTNQGNYKQWHQSSDLNTY